MKMRPTRFGQGTHPPSLSRIGVASKERATVDDRQMVMVIAHK